MCVGFPVSRTTPVQPACKSTTFACTTHVDALDDEPDNLQDMQIDEYKDNDKPKKVKKIQKKRQPKPKTPPPEYVYNCNSCNFGFNSILEFNSHKTKCIPTGKSWNFAEHNQSETPNKIRDKHSISNGFQYPNQSEDNTKTTHNKIRDKHSINNGFQYPNQSEDIGIPINKFNRLNDSLNEPKYKNSEYNLQESIHESPNLNADGHQEFKYGSSIEHKASYTKVEYPYNCGHCGSGYESSLEFDFHKSICIPDEDFSQYEEQSVDRWTNNNKNRADEHMKSVENIYAEKIETSNKIVIEADDNIEAQKTKEEESLGIIKPSDNKNLEFGIKPEVTSSPSTDIITETQTSEIDSFKSETQLSSKDLHSVDVPQNYEHPKIPKQDNHQKVLETNIDLKVDNTMNRKPSKKSKRIKVQRPPPKPKDPPPEYVYNCSDCEFGFNSMLEFNYHKTKCIQKSNTCPPLKQNKADVSIKKSEVESKNKNDILRRVNSYKAPKIAEYRQPTISQDIKSEFQSIHLKMKQIDKENVNEDDLQLTKKKRLSRLITPPLETQPLEYVYNCNDCNSGYNSMLEFNYHKRKCIPDNRFKESSGSLKEKKHETSKDETSTIINRYTKSVDNEEKENNKSISNSNDNIEMSDLSPNPSYTYTEISVEYNFQYNQEEETLSPKSQVNNSLTAPTVIGNQQDKLPSKSKAEIFSTEKQSLLDTSFNSTDSLDFIKEEAKLNLEHSNVFSNEQCLAEKRQPQNIPEINLPSDIIKSQNTNQQIPNYNQQFDPPETEDVMVENQKCNNKQEKNQSVDELITNDYLKHNNSADIKPSSDDNQLHNLARNKIKTDKVQKLNPPDLYRENNPLLIKSQSENKLKSDNTAETVQMKQRPTSQVIFLSPNSFLPAPPPVTTVMLCPKKHYNKPI